MPKATQSGNFKAIALPEPQTAVARCYSMIDFGTVPNIYNNVQDGMTHKIYATWEFPKLMGMFNEEKGEEPFVIGMEMTLSTNDQSNLAKLISHWRNKPLTETEKESFDVNQMVNKVCMISFIHQTKSKFKGKDFKEITNENTVLKFNGIMPKPEEVTCPPMMNPEMIWDWDPIKESGTFDAEKFQKIPQWLRKRIKESDEFKEFGYDPDDSQSGSSGTSPAAKEAEKNEKIDDSGGW